eukprot:gene9831-10839_t
MLARRSVYADSVFQFLMSREKTSAVRIDETLSDRLTSRHLPTILREKTYTLGENDKIFSSAWLDDVTVICGSKCNKLIVLNLLTRKTWSIPLIKGSPNAPAAKRNCGIHSIAIDPTRSFLATGGSNPNSLGVYSLPSMDELCLGESHTDWIFSLAWISPSHIASGSRDGTVAVWEIKKIYAEWFTPSLKCQKIMPRQVIKNVETIDKVRDIVYNTESQELAALSSNAFVHFLDTEMLKKTTSIPLMHCQENVCMACGNCNRLYAIGSLSHVSFVDSRTSSMVGSICSKDQGAGVRSLSFKDYVLTIGTGMGSILFYDLRAQKFLENSDGSSCQYKIGKGWLRDDIIYRHYFWEFDGYPNAVYTHSYNEAKTKLFTAGGPLALGLYGNYAGLWE